MKIYLHIPLLLLFTASALSSESISEEAAMTANGRLKVSNVSGSVEILGWSKKRIEVTGELGDGAELIFEVDGNTARVEVENQNHNQRSHKRWGNDQEDTDLVIHVPKSTRVSASTVSADLNVQDIEGILRLQTVSGDLQAQLYDQEAEIKSVSGEIDIAGNGSSSSLTVRSVSGDIDANDIGGEIVAQSVSGDLEVLAKSFTRLEMKSVSGNLDCSGKLETGGRIDAEAISGDITLDLDSLYNTDFYLESFSGDIRPIMGYKAERQSKYSPGERLELTEGDGASRIRIETMSGDIDINPTGKMRKDPDVQQTSSRVDKNRRATTDFKKAMSELDKAMETVVETATAAAVSATASP